MLQQQKMQGRSNGLKGGGDTKISARAFGARIESLTSQRNFSAKIFSVVYCASRLTNGKILQIFSFLDKMKGICKPE